jgi:hypothetical protein
MTVLVGVILLLVFLGFAALMFLERLSALLALPLMAVAFLLVATVADLAQPATVTELVTSETIDAAGGKHLSVTTQPTSARFALYQRARRQQAELLRDKAALLADAVAQVRAELQRGDSELAARLSAAVARIHAADQEFARRAQAALDALPAFFARPPLHAGLRGQYEDELRTVAVSETFRPILPLAGAEHLTADARAKIDALLARAAADSQKATHRYGTPPEPHGRGFVLWGGLSYLLNYLIFVLRAGSLSLAAPIIATIFGGMFAMYVKNLNVAERLIYWTAEYAGQQPFVISLAVFLVTAAIFTSVGGLGTVIMLGTIVLPVLRSVGMGPVFGAGIFLLGIAMGGTLQPVSRRLWMDFYGIPAAQLNTILWITVAVYFVCGLAWMWWGTRQALRSSFHAVATPAAARAAQTAQHADVPARLMLAPLVPVALVYGANIEEISAFVLSIAYMYVCVSRRPGATRILARTLIAGAQAVMPPVLVIAGIGILVTALSTPPVQSYLRPLLSSVVPQTRWGFIALFALAAPLALYRGPLNVWGMGLAVSATLLATSSLPPAAILGAILAAGMLQSVCDPTNTANVWIAGYQGVSVNRILRSLLGPVWLAAAVTVLIFGLRYVS